MTAKIIDGRALAREVQIVLKKQLENSLKILKFHEISLRPGLAVILVGNDLASEVYVKQKAKACENIGILSRVISLPQSSTTNDIIHVLERLTTDDSMHGVIVQLPLPAHVDTQQVTDAIPLEKDVDGFHPHHMGLLALRRPSLRPCTPHGIIKMLQSIDEPFKGRHAVIIGASNIVGRPMALELLLAGATVTICHKFTERTDLLELTRNADILISAVGRPGLIGGLDIKRNSTLIDVGITKVDGILKGDFKDSVRETAAFVSPVPGGVGPMTVAMLMQNTIMAWKQLTFN